MISSIFSMRAIDVLDILLVFLVVYWLLLFIRGTRAVQILFGLLVLMFLYVISKKVELITFQWLLGTFLENLLVVIVVIFQSEIRRALAKIGQWRFFVNNGFIPDQDVLDEIVKCAFRFSSSRIGAIFLLERQIGLEDFVEHGKKIDAVFSTELAESVFNVTSPIHDGAVVIRGNRIEAAGIILPIPQPSLETQGMGTRHRAAFGAAADTDAVAVVVSEETGNVTVFNNRVVMQADSPEELHHLLGNIFREEKERRQYKVGL